MFTLRNMLEKEIRVKGLSYYNYCWNLQHKNAKVVQGSSHDVVGLTEIFNQQHGQISDNNYFYFQPAEATERFLVKYLYNIILYLSLF